MLPRREFLSVIKKVPLVAIDFILNSGVRGNKILLGKRNNKPADGTFFVPGGRIRKDEPIAEAIERISYDEFGFALGIRGARFKGVFDHFYEDNFANDDFGTHYVVIALEYRLSVRQFALISALHDPADQHSEFEWMSIAGLMRNKEVHQNVKRYFKPSKKTDLLGGKYK